MIPSVPFSCLAAIELIAATIAGSTTSPKKSSVLTTHCTHCIRSGERGDVSAWGVCILFRIGQESQGMGHLAAWLVLCVGI